jgi:hypothetical protein
MEHAKGSIIFISPAYLNFLSRLGVFHKELEALRGKPLTVVHIITKERSACPSYSVEDTDGTHHLLAHDWVTAQPDTKNS